MLECNEIPYQNWCWLIGNMFKAYSCKIWGKRENLKVQMVFLSVKWFATNHTLGSLSCKESVFSGGNSSLSGLQIYSSNRLLKIFFS